MKSHQKTEIRKRAVVNSKRRDFLSAGASLALSAALPVVSARAADITFNVAYAGGEDSEYGLMTALFKQHVERLVPGVTIKPRCCASLVTEDEAFKAMQLGTVDMAIITSNNISPHYPLMDAFVLPYIFRSPDHGYRVFDGEVGREFLRDFEEKTKVSILVWSAILYRDFYNTVRPIRTMADMEGIKIRVPKNEVMLDTFQAFGAAPIPLPWSETPPALQTGTVQGGDNGTTFIKTLKFYEIASNLAILEHFAAFTPLLASARAMSKLSSEQRKKMREAGRMTDLEYRRGVMERTEQIRRFLGNEGGMEVTRPDKTDFLVAAKKVQDEWLASKGDDFRALVDNIRNTQ